MNLDLDYTSLEEGSKKSAMTFESGQTKIIYHMLQRTFDYANRKAQKVHVYFQIADGRAAADFLFEFDGKVFEINELEMVDVDFGIEFDEDRHQWLMKGVAEELLAYINHCVSNKKPVPNEVWTTVDIAKDAVSTTTAFNIGRPVPEVKEGLRKWKSELRDPSYLVMRDIAIEDAKLV